MEHGTRLLTLEFFRNLHGLLENNMLHVPEDDKLSGWITVEHFCVTDLALPLVFATIGD